MPDSLFKITPTDPTAIQVPPGQEGKFSFTIESLAAPDQTHEIQLQALLVDQEGKGKELDSLVVGPKRTLSISGGKTETVTITVTAALTTTKPRGAQKLKLVIAEKHRTNEVLAESSTVELTVPEDKEPDQAPGKRRWWLIPVIAGGALVVVGVTVLVIWKITSTPPPPPPPPPHLPGLGEPCGADAASACDEGLVCVAGVRRCLLASGAPCTATQAGLCASGECNAKAAACARPLGDSCNPGEKDLVPCLANSTCDPATKKCLGNVGTACKLDGECVTGRCTDNLCTPKAPAIQAGDPCKGTCPEPLQCSATIKRCVEQVGRPCSNNNQCATGLCEQAVCTRPELARNCTQDGICGPDQKCVEIQPGINRCTWQPGHPCRGNADCSSRWCSAGTCTRDDGKCTSQSDCLSPYRCFTDSKLCLLPDGQTCISNAECRSYFCSKQRCVASPCASTCSRGLCNNDEKRPQCRTAQIWVKDLYLNPQSVPWKNRIVGP
jgi:hypothetical protein